VRGKRRDERGEVGMEGGLKSNDGGKKEKMRGAKVNGKKGGEEGGSRKRGEGGVG